jgi:hypothetical protein
MTAGHSRTSRWWIALAGSFAVYLIPLAGPHAVWLLGESLFTTPSGGRNTQWLAANLLLAIAAQVVVALVLAWSLRGSRRRLLVWIPAIPVFVAAMNVAYLVAIPSHFLIEPDTRPELRAWKEQCNIPQTSLMPVRTTANLPSLAVREWWLQRPDGRYSLLSLPDCRVTDAPLPVPVVQAGGRADFTLGFQFSSVRGAVILERLVPSTSQRSWWLLADASSAPEAIEQVPADVAPILSDEADAVAWLEQVPGSRPPVLHRLVVRALRPSPDLDRIQIDLSSLGPGSYTLISVNTTARDAVLWNVDRPLVVGFDGSRRDYRFDPGPMSPQASTFLRHRDGWVAWDAYRDDGPYQLSWSLSAGSGKHLTNKGRSITAAALDPSARLIAISESTTLSIGEARDVVYVIQVNDGSEVFRAYLSRYARSPVVFFDGGYFGYSDLDGTHILTIFPGPQSPIPNP